MSIFFLGRKSLGNDTTILPPAWRLASMFVGCLADIAEILRLEVGNDRKERYVVRHAIFLRHWKAFDDFEPPIRAARLRMTRPHMIG